MRAKINTFIRLATGVGVAAALLAGTSSVGAESGFTPAGTPHVFVHLQDSSGTPVTGGCFMMVDEPLGEPIYAEACDGADGIFTGDGFPDGTVDLDPGSLPGTYAIYTVMLPNGDQIPDHIWPRPVPFTYGSSDVHITITMPTTDGPGPVLSLPGPMVVDATSPAGATVSYPASAQDGQGNRLAVSCTPPSGSTFAVGVTSVSCSANDGQGRTTGGGFFVTVRDARAQLDDLLAKVQGVGPGRSLYAKVQAAVAAYESGNLPGACAALADFLRQVNAQADKSLTRTQAAEFNDDATRIRAVIGC